MLSVLLGLGLALAPAAAPEACVPIEGAEAVLGDRDVHWLVVGEMHGTREMPASFAELVCAAAQSHRTVTVALEFPEADQTVIDAYLASDGGDDARSHVLALPFWSTGRDGRSSEAAFALLEWLRRMKQAGEIQAVRAIQPMSNETRSDYEKAMAALVLEAGPADGLTMVLVGGVHAKRVPYTSPDGKAYLPMAGYLPEERTKTVLASGQGGSAWVCILRGTDGDAECGPRTLNAPGKLYPRGLVILDRAGGPYNGYLNIGMPFTASPPMVSDMGVQP